MLSSDVMGKLKANSIINRQHAATERGSRVGGGVEAGWGRGGGGVKKIIFN